MKKERTRQDRMQAVLVLALMGLWQPVLSQAWAADPERRVEGEQLQRQAEDILMSEPGAKQVTVRVEVEPVVPAGKNAINLDDFDLNRDGVLARDEVGEKLFRIFDTDGNEVIDNIEMKTPRLLVFSPMEKKTIEIIDYRDMYRPTRETVSHEEFLHQSKLGKFDKDQDGLSPLDFIEKPFNQVNVRRDGVIDMEEWKRAYAAFVRPKHMEEYNYNG